MSSVTLKSPYEIAKPISAIRALEAELKTMEKQYGNDRKKKPPGRLQCFLVSLKPVRYGQKVTVWLLGYAPGLTGDATGVTKEQWATISTGVKMAIQKHLGPTPAFEIEPWSKTDKFDARYETYVFTE